MQTSKNGGVIKASETMLGKKVVRRGSHEGTGSGIDIDQEDTCERLAKVARAYRKTNTIVHKMIQMFIENNFNELTLENLRKASKTANFCVAHYENWEQVHNRYKIVERKGDTWSLRPIIKKHLCL